MSDRPGGKPDSANVVGADHDKAMDTVTTALGIPRALLDEAIVEARAAGRHRVRAVPARRIDELVSELADTTGARGTD